jgi:hypothetical protein
MNIKTRIWYSAILVMLILTGCERDFSPLSIDHGRWVSDVPFTYTVLGIENTIPHDNRIYESANFLIFSDACSDDVKKQVSEMAEKSLEELKQAFHISSSAELGITDQDSKVKIYANKYGPYPQIFFSCGFIIFSPDSPNSVPGERYYRVVKHELMHVFQHLLGLGLNGYDDWPEVWFSEGIAEFMCGGVFPVITSQIQVSQWLADEDHINPISIQSFQDYPVSLPRIGEYYPMFELAVRYLLSDTGQGREISDVKLLYEALRNGDSFNDAFECNMGIGLEDYENQFFLLISEFLQ